MDGGFFQILTTTSVSKTFNEVASAAVLGGAENVARKLKELKIRFGQIVGDEKGQSEEARKVGFGLRTRLLPYEKGANLE